MRTRRNRNIARAAVVVAASLTAYLAAPGVVAQPRGADGSSAGNGAATTPLTPQALGQATTDLVYVPITPCRIIDTREAVGAFNALQTRSYSIAGATNYTAFGGAASTCNVPAYFGSSTEPAALNLNFAVVSSSPQGFLTAFPAGAPRPNTSVLNWFGTGQILSNTATVTTAHFVGNDFSIYASAPTDVIVDVMGYFIAPEPTQLDTVRVESTALSVPAGSTGTDSTPSCPAGYAIVGGGASSSTFDGRIVTLRPFTDTYFAAFRNEGAVAMNVVVYGICARVPGRARA